MEIHNKSNVFVERLQLLEFSMVKLQPLLSRVPAAQPAALEVRFNC